MSASKTATPKQNSKKTLIINYQENSASCDWASKLKAGPDTVVISADTGVIPTKYSETAACRYLNSFFRHLLPLGESRPNYTYVKHVILERGMAINFIISVSHAWLEDKKKNQVI